MGRGGCELPISVDAHSQLRLHSWRRRCDSPDRGINPDRRIEITLRDVRWTAFARTGAGRTTNGSDTSTQQRRVAPGPFEGSLTMHTMPTTSRFSRRTGEAYRGAQYAGSIERNVVRRRPTANWLTVLVAALAAAGAFSTVDWSTGPATPAAAKHESAGHWVHREMLPWQGVGARAASSSEQHHAPTTAG